MKDGQKLTIGRTDKIDFPDWGLNDIDAKIDSGAYTSSIHCKNIEAFYENGEHMVRFALHGNEQEITTACKVFASKQVKNSFGQIEYRYSVKATICLFGKKYLTEFTLTDRSTMKYPVLLGRKLLRDRFLIDVNRQNLSYREKMNSRKAGRKAAGN